MADINTRAEMLTRVQTPGTYTMAPGVNYGVLSSAANGVALRAENPTSALASRPELSRVLLNGVSNLTLDGIHLNYVYNGEPASYNTCEIVSCDDFTMQNSIVVGDVTPSDIFNGNGVRAFSSNRQLYQNNEIRHFTKCLRLEGDDVQVISNNIGPVNSDAIGLGNGVATVSNVIIRGNYIHDRTKSAPDGHGDCIQLQVDVDTVLIEDNFFDENIGQPIQGIHAASSTSKIDVTVRNNVGILGLANAFSGGNFTNLTLHNYKVHRNPNTLGAGGTDDTTGAFQPKMLPTGSGTVTNCQATQIQWNGVSQDGIGGNVWSAGDYITARAAARADPRWSHFFTAAPTTHNAMIMPNGAPLIVNGLIPYVQ